MEWIRRKCKCDDDSKYIYYMYSHTRACNARAVKVVHAYNENRYGVCQRDNNPTGMKMSAQGHPLILKERREIPRTTGQAAAVCIIIFFLFI